tara:strand:- start:273 stop:506 length:234 start_codon:yes stop_codon:yes gene_type:complete
MKKKQYLVHLKCQKLDKVASLSVDANDFDVVYDLVVDEQTKLSEKYKQKFRIIGIYEVLYDIEKFNRMAKTSEVISV